MRDLPFPASCRLPSGLLAVSLLASACGSPAASRPMTASSARAPTAADSAATAAVSGTVRGAFTEPGAREEVELAVEDGEDRLKRAVLVLRTQKGAEIARLVAGEEPADTTFEPTWSLVGPVPLGESGKSGVVLLRRSLDQEASGLAAELTELTIYAARGSELERVHSESADRIHVKIDGALLRLTLIERLGAGPEGEQVAENQVTLGWRGQGFAESP